MTSTIAILYNTFSAKGKGRRIAFQLSQLSSHTILCSENEWPLDINQYHEIWLVGGDGTVNYFLNKYLEINRPLLIFPGGTGNDIHWKLYGNISWDKQLENIQNYSPKLIDLGICNDKIFINGIGIGFDGEVLKSMNSIRFVGGHLGYLMVVIKKIFSFKEPNYKILINGKVIEQKCMLLSIANSSRTGGGFMVSPLAEVNDGLLNLFYCKPLSIFKRLLALPKVEKGTHLTLPFVHHETLTAVVIDAAYEIYAQIDGELFLSKRFEIQLLGRKLEIRC